MFSFKQFTSEATHREQHGRAATIKRLSVVSAVAVLAVAGCANLQRSRDLGNPNVAGDVLAVQVCADCHGVDGNSINPQFPRLAGQQEQYLINQLTHFRAHQRSDPAGTEYMWGIAQHLTDKQIKELAEYFSKQTPKPGAPTDPKLDALGKNIFEHGIPSEKVIACQACHGPQAQGIGAFPRLANQHADYIVKQLTVFKEKLGRPGTPMTYEAHPLTGNHEKAVAAFLQSYPN